MESRESVVIEIKTAADLQAAQRLKTSLNEAIKSAQAAGQPTDQYAEKLRKVDAALESAAAKNVKHAASQDKVADATKKLSGETAKAGDKIGHIKGLLQEAQGAFTSAGGGAAGFASALGVIIRSPIVAVLTAIIAALAAGSAALKEYASNEKAIAGLDQALANQANLTKQLREEYQQLAGTLQGETSIAAVEWFNVLRKLTQFGMRPDDVDKYTEAVKNLAGIYDGDIKRATEGVAKAMKGQFEAFREAGIVIDNTKTQGEKMADLFDQLKTMGGGQLEARAKTIEGLMFGMQNAFNDLSSAVGAWIAKTGIVQSVLGGLTTAFSYWAEAIGAIVPQLAEVENGLASMRQGTVDLQAAQQRLQVQTENQQKALAKAGDEMTKQLGILAAIKAAEDQVAEAKKKAMLAELEYQKQTGAITQQQFERRQLEINQRFDRDRLSRQQQFENRQAQEIINTRGQLEQQRAGVQTNRQQADERLSVITEAQRSRFDVQRLEQRLEEATQQLAEAEAKMSEMIGRQASEGSNVTFDQTGRMRGISDSMLADQQREVARLRGRTRTLGTGVASAREADSRLRPQLDRLGLAADDGSVNLEAVANARIEAENARKLAEQSVSEIDKKIAELNYQLRLLGIQGQGRAQVRNIENQTQQTERRTQQAEQAAERQRTADRERQNGGQTIRIDFGQDRANPAPQAPERPAGGRPAAPVPAGPSLQEQLANPELDPAKRRAIERALEEQQRLDQKRAEAAARAEADQAERDRRKQEAADRAAAELEAHREHARQRAEDQRRQREERQQQEAGAAVDGEQLSNVTRNGTQAVVVALTQMAAAQEEGLAALRDHVQQLTVRSNELAQQIKDQQTV